MLAALGGVVVWQLLPSSDPHAGTSQRALADRAETAPAPVAPASGPYNVEGIEGIVKIDDSAAERSVVKGGSGPLRAPVSDLAREARAGDAKAMAGLAMALRAGSDSAADPLAAIDWLQRASAGGDANAMAALAAEYESGAWLPADPRKARSLREAAARAGSRLAQWELEP